MLEPIDHSKKDHSVDISTKNNQLANNFIELAKLWNGGEDLDPNSDRGRSVLETADKIRTMAYDVGDLIEKEGASYIRMHHDWKHLSHTHATDLKLLAYGLTPQQALDNRVTSGS